MESLTLSSFVTSTQNFASVCIMTQCQGWNCRGGGLTPLFMSTDAHCLSENNFNPWAKFQTFRHLTPQFF